MAQSATRGPRSARALPQIVPSEVVEEARRRLDGALVEVLARAQQAADQATERVAAAAGLGLRLAYATVGAAIVAQEAVAGRVRAAGR